MNLEEAVSVQRRLADIAGGAFDVIVQTDDGTDYSILLIPAATETWLICSQFEAQTWIDEWESA